MKLSDVRDPELRRWAERSFRRVPVDDPSGGLALRTGRTPPPHRTNAALLLAASAGAAAVGLAWWWKNRRDVVRFEPFYKAAGGRGLDILIAA